MFGNVERSPSAPRRSNRMRRAPQAYWKPNQRARSVSPASQPASPRDLVPETPVQPIKQQLDQAEQPKSAVLPVTAALDEPSLAPQRDSTDARCMSQDACIRALETELLSIKSKLIASKALIADLQVRLPVGPELTTQGPPHPDADQHLASQTPFPRTSPHHQCSARFVFENVPGIVAGMRPCDALPIIITFLTTRLHIASVSQSSLVIARVSKAGTQRPVVVIQVTKSLLLSDILASKTSAMMGPSCNVHIYPDQPLRLRPGQLGTHQKRTKTQRTPAMPESQPKTVETLTEVADLVAESVRRTVAGLSLKANPRGSPATLPRAPILLTNSPLSPLAPVFVPSPSPCTPSTLSALTATPTPAVHLDSPTVHTPAE